MKYVAWGILFVGAFVSLARAGGVRAPFSVADVLQNAVRQEADLGLRSAPDALDTDSVLSYALRAAAAQHPLWTHPTVNPDAHRVSALSVAELLYRRGQIEYRAYAQLLTDIRRETAVPAGAVRVGVSVADGRVRTLGASDPRQVFLGCSDSAALRPFLLALAAEKGFFPDNIAAVSNEALWAFLGKNEGEKGLRRFGILWPDSPSPLAIARGWAVLARGGAWTPMCWDEACAVQGIPRKEERRILSAPPETEVVSSTVAAYILGNAAALLPQNMDLFVRDDAVWIVYRPPSEASAPPTRDPFFVTKTLQTGVGSLGERYLDTLVPRSSSDWERAWTTPY